MKIKSLCFCLLLLTTLDTSLTTIFEVLEDALESEIGYKDLIEFTALVVNENVDALSSLYVATIGAGGYVSNEVLKRVNSSLAVPNERYGPTANVLVFLTSARNLTSVILQSVHSFHKRGRFVICVTTRYFNNEDVIENFALPMIDLWLRHISQVLLCVLIKSEVSFYGLDPYRQDACFPASLVKLATGVNGAIARRSPFYRRFNNLNGCCIRVVTEDGMPYVETYVENNVKKVRGIEGNAMTTIADRMNFTMNITNFSDLENLTSEDTKQTLLRNLSDLVFGSKKVTLGDYESTVSLMNLERIWVVPKSKRISAWQQLVPFQTSVWLAFISTTGIVLFLSPRFKNDDRGLLRLNIWAIFLGVSVEMTAAPKKLSTKIFLVTWLLFSYIVAKSYLSSMEGILTKPMYAPEVNTYKQLVASNLRLYGPAFIIKLFCADNDTNDNIICHRYEGRLTDSIFEEISVKGKIDVAFVAKSGIVRNSKFLREYDHHVMKDLVLGYTIAFIAQPGCPYLDEVNKLLFHLIEGGFLSQWIKENEVIKRNRKLDPEKLKFEHIAGISYLALAGYAMAIAVFLFEYFYKPGDKVIIRYK